MTVIFFFFLGWLSFGLCLFIYFNTSQSDLFNQLSNCQVDFQFSLIFFAIKMCYNSC